MKYSRIGFWGFIVLGILLPVVVGSIVVIFLDPTDLGNLLFALFGGNNIETLFLNLLRLSLYALPFFVLALFYKGLKNNQDDHSKRVAITAGIIVSALIVLISQLVLYLNFFIILYSSNHPSECYTIRSGITFIVISFCLAVIILPTYFITYRIAKLIVKKGKKKSQKKG